MRVSALFVAPSNLARLARTEVAQSSVYNNLFATFAVNGDTDGKGQMKCIHTQLDAAGWWQADLGRQCIVQKINLWNRQVR